MNQRGNQRIALWVAIALIPLIFLVDLVTPLGFDIGLFYLLPMVMIARSAARRLVILTAAGLSILVVVSLFVSQPGMQFGYGLLNAMACIAVLWLATSFLLDSREAEELHAGRLEILHDIDRAVLEALAPPAIALATLPRLREAVPCDRAGVMIFDAAMTHATVLRADGDIVPGLETGSTIPLADIPARTLEVLREGAAWQVPDLSVIEEIAPLEVRLRDAGHRSWACVPLLTQSRLIGVLNLTARTTNAFGPEQLALAHQVADSLAVAIRNSNLVKELQASREQLQELSHHLVHVQETERQAIARELHDEAGQVLTMLTVQLGMLAGMRECPPAVTTALREAQATARGVMEQLHHIVVNLRPASLDQLGLISALTQYTEQYARLQGVEVQMEAVGFENFRLPEQVETNLYRIVQESLTNVSRHAQAKHVGVVLNQRDGRVAVVIEDDGVGFDPAASDKNGRLGVMGMRERAIMLGGTLTVESAPGRGTTLFVDVPCRA